MQTMSTTAPRRPYVRKGLKSCGPQARRLASEVAQAYGITFEDLSSPSRLKRFAWPRQHAMAVLRDHGYSETHIGLLLNRDPSTVSTGSARHHERAAWADLPVIGEAA